MDDAIGMEKCEGQNNVVTDVDLDVVRNRLSDCLKEVGQAFVHELHQKNRETSIGISAHAQVLNDIGVPYGVQEFTLLLKPPDG